jgi:hypothetical protein
MMLSGFNFGAWIGGAVRKTEISNTFYQLAGGFEALSENIDGRLNWYGPITDPQAGTAGYADDVREFVLRARRSPDRPVQLRDGAKQLSTNAMIGSFPYAPHRCAGGGSVSGLCLGACSARAMLIEAQNLSGRLLQAANVRSLTHAALHHRPQHDAQAEHHSREPEPEYGARGRAHGAANIGKDWNPEQRRSGRQKDAAPDLAERAPLPRRSVTEDRPQRAWWKSWRMRRASHTRISMRRDGGTCLAAAHADHEDPISNCLRKNLPGSWFRASFLRPAFRRVDRATCQMDAMHQSRSLQQQA